MQFIRVSHCDLLPPCTMRALQIKLISEERHPKIMPDVQVYCPVMLLAVDTIIIGTEGMGKIAF